MDKMNGEGSRDSASWLMHGESHRQATLFTEEACRINRIVHLKIEELSKVSTCGMSAADVSQVL